MSNNNPTNPSRQGANNSKPVVPKQPAPEPIPAGLAPVPLRRVGRLPKVSGIRVTPQLPNGMGGKRHTRRKHRKSRKTHRRRR